MTINVRNSVEKHVNEAFASKGIDGLAFVGRLLNAELEQYQQAAALVIGRRFELPLHEKIYEKILKYTLDRYSLSETISILGHASLTGDADLIEHNLLLLASDVAGRDNTWSFFKKEDLNKQVADILNPPKVAEEAKPADNEVELLTNKN